MVQFTLCNLNPEEHSHEHFAITLFGRRNPDLHRYDFWNAYWQSRETIWQGQIIHSPIFFRLVFHWLWLYTAWTLKNCFTEADLDSGGHYGGSYRDSICDWNFDDGFKASGKYIADGS
jgi:hypothetical protein